MSDNEALRSLNVSVADWEQRRDETSIAHLDSVLSPDLMFRRANGDVVDKITFMAGLNDPSPFAGRASEILSVDVLGQNAVVVVMVTTADANGIEARFRNVRALRRTADGWQIGFWFNERWGDYSQRTS